ncbi:hypothetical protein QQ045_004992 [Rhodiola kirilowii]
MDQSAVTPGKSPQIYRSKATEGSNYVENANPNLTKFSPAVKSGKSSKSASKNSSLLMSPRNLDPSLKIDGSVSFTPVKSPNLFRSRTVQGSNFGENINPNFAKSSPAAKSGKNSKSASKNPRLLVSPKNLMRERRFVVAKKKGSKVCEKCKEKGVKKCICAAYESLRASQEMFFEKQCEGVDDKIASHGVDGNIDQKSIIGVAGDQIENSKMGLENEADGAQNENPKNGVDGLELELEEDSGLSSAIFKRNRDKLLEEARESVPEAGSGRVMHLVKAFEKLLSMKKKSTGGGDDGGNADGEQQKESEDFYKRFMSTNRKVMNWALPGMQLGKECEAHSHDSMSSFCPSDLFLTSEKLGLESRSSMDSSFGSVSSGAASGGRRKSTESCGSFRGRRWKKKQLKVTDQKPFKLRTEQRGRMKEEELMRKIRKMMEDQERMRIPIAQGLPWTTDEPECLVKPPVKECTQPIDLKLHSDVRAVERAEFDHQVAEKMSLLEQYRMEWERQKKLAEEEEIRRLRKELVPKAQPMPYFDRPFIPRRSEKHPTVPKEPKFHKPEHKKIRCMSLTDFGPYSFHY